MKKDTLLNQIRQSILNVSPDARIILFGSQARGNARDDSDWDLLVLLEKAKPSFQDKEDISYSLFQLELENHVQIHPLIYSRSEWEQRIIKTPFYNNVLREGILIH